jgi:hypothetical protein
MTAALDRVEFWSDIEAAGGVRLALIPNIISCTERRDLKGESSMVLTIHRDNPALKTLDLAVAPPSGQVPPDALNGWPPYVLRAIYSDGELQERRIATTNETDEGGETRVSITAFDMLQEISNTGLCFRTHANGERTYNFQASGLTIVQHVNLYVIPALVEAGQSWWAMGGSEYTSQITVVYDKDSPLSACRRIASAAAGGLEFRVRYNATNKRYTLDFLQQIGVQAPTVRLRPKGGLRSLGITRSTEDVVTRVYGFGAGDEELGTATMADNAWAMSALRFDPADALWALTLEDPAGGPGPIAYDGQFVGQYLLELAPLPGQAPHRVPIVKTSAESSEVKANLSGITIRAAIERPLWRFQSQTATDLVYVDAEKPAGATKHPLGIRAGYVDRPEAVGVVNILPNPLQRVSVPRPVPSTDVPGMPFWYKQNTGITALIESNPIYWRNGGRSLRVTLADPLGYIAVQGVTTVTDARLSYYGDVLTLAGAVRVRLYVHITKPTPFTMPDGTQNTNGFVFYPDDWDHMHPNEPLPPTWRSLAIGQWERLGIANCHDAINYPTDQVEVHFQAVDQPFAVTRFLVDSAQVTGTQTWRELVEGSGSNVLMQEANARLLNYSSLAVSIAVDSLDLGAIGDPSFPAQDYVVGGPVLLLDENLAAQIRTRVLGWDRDWFDPSALRVQVATSKVDLTHLLAYRPPSAAPVR